MKPYLCNFNQSLVNLSSSILKYFGIEPFHSTIKELDDILSQKDYKKITVLLFDGLNKYIKKQNLKDSDCLIKKAKFNITSVFPPTTVAATTAFLSGKFPVENGWLGWSQRFHDLNVTVDMFSNKISSTKEKYSEDISYKYCNYTSIIDLINQSGKAHALSVFPKIVNGGEATDIDNFFDILNSNMKKDDRQFIYGYWNEPDSLIHKYGTTSPIVRKNIKHINKQVASLAKNNPDNLIIVIADHGLIDAKYDNIREHSDLFNLIDNFHLDARAVFVDVKKENHQQFIDLFNKYYSNDYIIYNKDEYIQNHIFGEGKEHPSFSNFLGDFLIVSLNEHSLLLDDAHSDMVGLHSGGMEEEYIISVAVFNQ